MIAVCSYMTPECFRIVWSWRRDWGRAKRISAKTRSSGLQCQEEKWLDDWTAAIVSCSTSCYVCSVCMQPAFMCFEVFKCSITSAWLSFAKIPCTPSILIKHIFYSFLSVPAISQHYIVPHPSGTVGSAREMRNNNAVYSLWSYFLDFLVSDPASVIRIPRLVIPPDANDLVNRHTGRRRLNLFIGMSRGKCAELCAWG